MSVQPCILLAATAWTVGVTVLHLGLNTRALDFAERKAPTEAEFRVGFLPVT